MSAWEYEAPKTALGSVVLEEVFLAFAGLLRQNGEVVLLPFGQQVLVERSANLYSLWAICWLTNLVSAFLRSRIDVAVKRNIIHRLCTKNTNRPEPFPA